MLRVQEAISLFGQFFETGSQAVAQASLGFVASLPPQSLLLGFQV